MTVLVFGYLRFPPECLEMVKPHLRNLVQATRKHDNCIAYDVAEDMFEPGLIRFSERWPNAEALAAHLRADHIAPWRAVCAEFGLIERSFTAFDAASPRPIWPGPR